MARSSQCGDPLSGGDGYEWPRPPQNENTSPRPLIFEPARTDMTSRQMLAEVLADAFYCLLAFR